MKRAPLSICEEIKKAYAFYHGDENSEIALYGGTFTGIKEWKEILLKVEECALKIGITRIRISTRPDEIEDAEFLSNHHVTFVEIGAQSMCEDVLEASKRYHSAKDVKNAIESLTKANVKVSVHLMTGLPKDTKSKSLFSAFEVANLNVDAVRIHPTLVLKETELERLYIQKKYVPQTLKEALDWVSDMVAIFLDSNITVERLGMYQDAQTLPNVVSGPYHPSFGELARAALYRKFLISTNALKVHAPDKLRSQIVGRNKDLKVDFKEDGKIWVESENATISFKRWLKEHIDKLKEISKCDS